MADREVLWGWDLDESPADLEDSNHSNGNHDPITEPIPVVDADHGVQEQPDDDISGNPEEIGTAFTYAGPFIDRKPGTPISTLTFKARPQPWYRTKKGFIALLAVVAAAVILAIIPLVMRSPGPDTDESTNVTPTTAGPAPTSAAPAPSDAKPTLTSAPAPPPPLPPPPPSPADDSPPAYYPPRYTPSEAEKPEIDVTRAPISVKPVPRKPPPNDADVGKRGNGGMW